MQEIFFLGGVDGINQINWIVWSIEQPAMNQIFSFFVPPFSSIFIATRVKIYHFTAAFAKKESSWAEISFQFRSREARWTSTGQNTTGLILIAPSYPESLKEHHLNLMLQGPWRFWRRLNRVEPRAKEAQRLHGPQWDHLLPRGNLFICKTFSKLLNFRTTNGAGTTAVSRWNSGKCNFECI